MRISDLDRILSLAKGDCGDIEVKTQAMYEMGLCDPPYDPADVSVCSVRNKDGSNSDMLIISFYGYDTLLDNGVDLSKIRRECDACDHWDCCEGCVKQ